MPFDYTITCPRRLHAPLAWLGKIKGWLGGRLKGERETVFSLDWLKVMSVPGWDEHGSTIKACLLDRAGKPIHPLAICWVAAWADALAYGPKVFRPTAEQFDSMQHVDLHVPVGDYRQPYPSMLVHIPVESRRALAGECGLPVDECPQVVIVHNPTWEAGQSAVFLGHMFRGYENVYFFQDRGIFATVEDALVKWVLKDGETDTRSHLFAQRSGRACLNLMLMLTNYGCRAGGPLDPPAHAKHRRKKELADLAWGDLTTIEMDQTIVVRDPRSSKNEPGDLTGREVRTHWRRGHWRHQRFGAGRAEVKMIFVRPCLVRGDRAVGDLADSSVVYRA